MMRRCGFAAILGAPNVGKSTLLNRLVGSKVSIVSPKVQTTRTRVLGICLSEETQIVFIDTPGIFEPRRRLDRAMVASAWDGAAQADETLLLIDVERGLDTDSRAIITRLKETQRRVLVVLNKIDLVRKETLLELTAALDTLAVAEEFFMISASNGDGVDDLLPALAARMPDGPWLYPEDQISDMPMRLLAAEITREQLYLQLHQELPYVATVETETWSEGEGGALTVGQIIYVQRDSQKAIVLGKAGRRIKAVGSAARRELEEIFEQSVHLRLFVKVRKDWTDDPERYAAWNLNFNA